MKNKLRILANLMLICLCACMFVYGVYAANKVTVQTNGIVEFEAVGIYARVQRQISGYASASENVVTAYDETIEVDDTEAPAISGERLYFSNKSTPISMTFTVTNLATDRYIDFQIIDNIAAQPVHITKTVNVSVSKYNGTHYTLTPNGTAGDTQTITISFAVVYIDNGFIEPYNYTIKMTERRAS